VSGGCGASRHVTDALLDTTFFIDLRKATRTGANELWDQFVSGLRSGAYSAVTAYELWVGQQVTREEEVFYLSVFQVLEEVPLSSEAAQLAGLWLRGQARTTAENRIRDAFIAASAALRREPVVTANVRDFRRLDVQVERY
jgi:predicted nucleic acid-binding protein